MKQMLEQIQIAKVTQLSKQCNVDDFEWETINNKMSKHWRMVLKLRLEVLRK